MESLQIWLVNTRGHWISLLEGAALYTKVALAVSAFLYCVSAARVGIYDGLISLSEGQ